MGVLGVNILARLADVVVPALEFILPVHVNIRLSTFLLFFLDIVVSDQDNLEISNHR